MNGPGGDGVHASFYLSILKYENPFRGTIKLRSPKKRSSPQPRPCEWRGGPSLSEGFKSTGLNWLPSGTERRVSNHLGLSGRQRVPFRVDDTIDRDRMGVRT